MSKIRLFKVSTVFGSREVNARSKREAIEIFKSLMKTLVSDSDIITVK